MAALAEHASFDARRSGERLRMTAVFRAMGFAKTLYPSYDCN
jgi:hypothetical protein